MLNITRVKPISNQARLKLIIENGKTAYIDIAKHAKNYKHKVILLKNNLGMLYSFIEEKNLKNDFIAYIEKVSKINHCDIREF